MDSTQNATPSSNPNLLIRLASDHSFSFELSHPILSSPVHPVLDAIKTILHEGFQFDQKKFYITKQFPELIFEGKSLQELKKIYEAKGLSFNPICGNTILPNVAFYICLDCDKLMKNGSDLRGSLCRECFLSSDHMGHRLLISPNKEEFSTSCDCGDASVFESHGFCKSHSGKVVPFEQILEGIGADTVKRFKEVISIAFYGLFSLVEVFIQTRLKHPNKETYVLSMIQMINFIGNILIQFLNVFAVKVNSYFIPIISELLQTRLPEQYNLLLHNCNEYKNLIFTDKEGPRRCNCTIMELLLKYIEVFLPDFQESLISFCNVLCKDEGFKKYMALTYMRTLYFLLYQNKPELIFGKELITRVIKLHTHFYKNTELCELVSNDPSIQNLMDLYPEILELNLKSEGKNVQQISELLIMTKRLLKPNCQSSKILIQEKMLGQIFLGMITEHANGFPNLGSKILSTPVPDDSDIHFLSSVMTMSGSLEKVFKRVIVRLKEFSIEEQREIKDQIIKKWKEMFTIEITKQGNKKDITFLPVLERTANDIIRGPELSITKEKVSGFLENLTSLVNGDLSKTAELLLENTVVQMGALRKLFGIGVVYFSEEFGLSDTDTTSVQMLLPWIQRESLLPFLIENWFESSTRGTREALQNEKTLDQMTKENIEELRDFLGLLIHWMIDETCLMRLKIKGNSRGTNLGCSAIATEDLNRVTKKILINLLAMRYWVDGNLIRENFKKLLCENNLENVLPELVKKDESSNKIRLKDEFLDQVDPFLFTHKKTLQKDLFDNLQEDGNKKHNFDTVSGVYDTNLPEYCYEVQKALFESALPNFLTKLMLISIEKNHFGLMKPLLRLILLHFQSTSYLPTKGIHVSLAKEKLEVYLTEEFTACLENILGNEKISDYHKVVRKILHEIRQCKGIYLSDESKEDKLDSVTEDAAKKKKFAEEKMKNLKEKFLNKQKAFLAHMEEENKDKMVAEETKEEDQELQCTSCLHRINSKTEAYGFPCYIHFVNNLSQEYMIIKDIEKKPFAVVHRCGHIFHRSCFESWKTKLKHEQGIEQLLLDSIEVYCPLCKSLTNFFCELGGGDMEVERDPQNTHLLKALGAIFLYSQTQNSEVWSIDSPEGVEEIITEGILSLRSMYHLYIETLHVFPHETFCKKFELYVDFLHCVKSQISQDKAIFDKLKADTQAKEQDSAWLNEILDEFLFAANPIRETILRILFEYLRSKLLEGLALFSPNFQKNNVEENADLISSVFAEQEIFEKEFEPLLQKAIVLLAFTEHLAGQKRSSQEMLDGLKKFKNDRFEFYFKSFGVQNLRELIANILSQTNTTESSFGEEYEFKEGAKEKLKLIIPSSLKPKRLFLPHNYQEFVDKYFKQPCSSCRMLPLHGKKILCLLCGQVFCKTRCSKSNIHFGNANLHSFLHCGQGIYLELHLLELIFVKSPKNLISRAKFIYVNEAGHAINSYITNVYDGRLEEISFKKFTLSSEALKYFDSIVENFLVPFELFHVGRRHAKIMVDGVL